MALKYKQRQEAKDAVKRATNMLGRSKSADSLRDKVSRAYYACYHCIVAATFLKQWFEKNPKEGSPHLLNKNLYVSHYSKTSGNPIIKEIKNVSKTLKDWKELRESADYDVFVEDFELSQEEETKRTLNFMYDFVDRHIAYVNSKLEDATKHSAEPTISTVFTRKGKD